MGVRCAVLGHVHDTTEFEERREERPNGTVLICREYQVCRRCGDREELYRNEQVLAPQATDPDPDGEREGDATATDPEAKAEAGGNATATDPEADTEGDVTATDPELDTDQQSQQADPDPDTNPAAPQADPDRETGTTAPGNDPDTDRDAEATTPRAPDSAGSADRPDGTERSPTDEPDEQPPMEGSGERAEILESDPRDATASGATDPAETGTGRRENGTANEAATDDAVILTGSSGNPEPSGNPETAAADPGTWEVESVEPDQRSTSPAGTASPGSSVGAGSDSADELSCRACGREWRRDATSLREGDLCPECRGGYVTAP